MKPHLATILLLLFSLSLAGCLTSGTSPHGQWTQWSDYAGNRAPASSAGVPLHTVLRSGDTGIGYLEGLDGELLFHRGQAFQLRADGQVFTPSPTTRAATAIVGPFRTDLAVVLSAGSDRSAIEQLLDEQVPDRSAPCIIRIAGRFEQIDISAPAPRSGSQPPAVRTNSLKRVSGTVTGIRFPEGAPALHPSGLHLLFLSHDLLNGGRATAFRLLDGTMEIHRARQLLFVYPPVRNGAH